MESKRSVVQLSHWIAGFAVIAGSWFLAAPTLVVAAQQGTAKKVVAAQIRRQGFTCDRPKSAVRDRERSKPHEAVWVLRCENIAYRVTLIPRKLAHVERIN